MKNLTALTTKICRANLYMCFALYTECF